MRQSSDDVFYLMHDGTVDRTTSGRGRIGWLTAAQIDQLDAGSWLGDPFAGERVPRLDEYLKWIKGQARVYIDAKVADPQPLIDMVRELEMADQVFFWFGNDKKERLFRRLPQISA